MPRHIFRFGVLRTEERNNIGLPFVLIYALVLQVTLSNASPEDCNACGSECINACGTAMFRACCFNYNRKRRSIKKINIFPDDSMDIDIRSSYARNLAPSCSSYGSHQVEEEPYRVKSYALWKSIMSMDTTKNRL